MIVQVQMLAFMDGEFRAVVIPDDIAEGLDTQQLLERVFYYGQNDIQPAARRCSVSVGDVALLPNKCKVCGHVSPNLAYWLVRPLGWVELTPTEYADYISMPRRNRDFSHYVRPVG